jgi:hypothetical protein
VAIGVQGNGYGGVSRKLLDELGVGVLGEKQRGAGVPEVVEAQVLPYAGAGPDALEGAVTEVRGVEYPGMFSRSPVALPGLPSGLGPRLTQLGTPVPPRASSQPACGPAGRGVLLRRLCSEE